jgi:hypothetical protein
MIPTGEVGLPSGDVFYVSAWELGVLDADGGFLSLYWQ